MWHVGMWSIFMSRFDRKPSTEAGYRILSDTSRFPLVALYIAILNLVWLLGITSIPGFSIGTYGFSTVPGHFGISSSDVANIN